MNLKWLFRVLTTRNWRGHKRRVFFENIFEDIKEDCANETKCENFNFIKNENLSYKNSCHEMAANYDYNPVTDQIYEMNIGKYFSMYHPQSFDSLYARIERKTSILRVLTSKKGVYHIFITGKEKGKTFKFSYRKFLKKVF